MKKFLICILSLVILSPAWSQKYVEYDAACMERMIYKLEDSKKGGEFAAYQIHLGNQQYVYLEVGQENTRVVQAPPERPVSCAAFPFGKRIVDDINQSKKVIYIAKKERNGYVVSPVKKAAFFTIIGSELSFTGKDAKFAINLDNPTYGRDLSLTGSQNSVFLDGVNFEQCAKGYIIRKTEDIKDKNYKELTFSPGIGIIEKRSVILTRAGAKVNVIGLKSVNGKSANDFIAAKCVEVQATAFDKTSARTTVVSTPDNYANESTILRIDPSSVTPSLATKGSPCTMASSEGLHIVQKGETLYSIARRYGLSLAQLKTWNGIDSRNIIQPCQALNVISSAVSNPDPAPVVTTTTTSSTPPQRNTTTSSTTKTTSSNGVNSTFDRTYLTGGTPAWTVSGNTHIVKSGETVYSIAKKYGYTEERLRWMNGMGEREGLAINQVIRVDGCNAEANPPRNTSGFTPYSDETAMIEAAPSDIGNFREFTPKSVDYSNVQVHIVQAGETLFSIARDYGTTIERIRVLNGFSAGEVIMRSQRIYVE